MIESPGVHAHGIKVFDGADDDALVLVVAHDLHLKFLPAEQAFFDEHLVARRDIEAVGTIALVFLAVVGDAAPAAAERVARADDDREVADQFVGCLERVGQIVMVAERATSRPIFSMACLKISRVLALFDGFRLRSDQFDPVFFENSGVAKSIDRFRPVWPPSVGSRASGFSRAMIFSSLR